MASLSFLSLLYIIKFGIIKPRMNAASAPVSFQTSPGANTRHANASAPPITIFSRINVDASSA